jgi:Tfp pilus assembly protein PilF
LLFCAVVGLTGALAGCPRDTVDSKKSHTRLELAKDFLGKGNLDAAEQEAQRALGFDTRNVEAHSVLGLIDFVRGLAAFRLLEVDDCLTGIDAEVLRRELDEHMMNAERHFVGAIELDRAFAEAWANRGAVADQLGDHDRAIEYFERSLENPARLQNASLVRANLGWAHFHKHDLVAAAKELRQALQFQPGMCVASYRLGRVYFERKEWEKALETLETVTKQPECTLQEAHLYLMKTYAELDMTNEVDTARHRCVEMAAKSCIAAQCRSIP